MPPKPQQQSKLSKWFHPVARPALVPAPHPPVPAIAAPQPELIDTEGAQTDASSIDGRPSEVVEDACSGRVPPLPVELWSQVARSVGNVQALAGTNRFFREVCYPILFETVKIGEHTELARLLALSQDGRVSELVRNLEVIRSCSCGSPSWTEQSTLIAVCVTHLQKLVSFTLKATDTAYLTRPLQIAMLTHPTLSRVDFNQWANMHNDLSTTFSRARAHRVVVEKIGCTYPLNSHGLPFDTFLTNITRYVTHFAIAVRVLHVTLDAANGPVTAALDKLLSTHLSGLEQIHLSFEEEEEESHPDVLQNGLWISRFLSANSTVTKIVLDIGFEAHRDNPISHLYIPIEGLSRVPGLDQVTSPELRDWCATMALEKIEMGLRRAETGWDLVGLELSPIVCFDCGHDFDLEPDVVSGLAAKFPLLETLRFNGLFGSSASLSEYIGPLASLSSLRCLTFPCNYIYSGPQFCYHDAEVLEEDLLDAQATWIEDEAAAIAEFERGKATDCSPEELERDRMLWESDSEAKDRDPDDRIYERLLTSGLLVSRPTVRQFANKHKKDWISLAERVTTLETIDWTFQEGVCSEIGLIRWRVVRIAKSTLGRSVSLSEVSCDRSLDVHVCLCDYRDGYEDLEDELDALPALFRQEANFTPAFTLDRFVSRS